METEIVKEAMENNRELENLFSHPKISSEEKINVVENIFKERVSDIITGLLVTMIEKGRSIDIISVLDYFLKEADEYRLIGTAYITSAVELNETQKQSIIDKLISTTKYKQFKVNYEVDREIIGGLVIRIGDRVVDSSIRTKINKMTEELYGVQI